MFDLGLLSINYCANHYYMMLLCSFVLIKINKRNLPSCGRLDDEKNGMTLCCSLMQKWSVLLYPMRAILHIYRYLIPSFITALAAFKALLDHKLCIIIRLFMLPIS